MLSLRHMRCKLQSQFLHNSTENTYIQPYAMINFAYSYTTYESSQRGIVGCAMSLPYPPSHAGELGGGKKTHMTYRGVGREGTFASGPQNSQGEQATPPSWRVDRQSHLAVSRRTGPTAWPQCRTGLTAASLTCRSGPLPGRNAVLAWLPALLLYWADCLA